MLLNRKDNQEARELEIADRDANQEKEQAKAEEFQAVPNDQVEPVNEENPEEQPTQKKKGRE